METVPVILALGVAFAAFYQVFRSVYPAKRRW
jgi:hypothetical protein